MKYGFAIIKEFGHGEPWWDEYYKTTEIMKVRLFNTKQERENGIKKEVERRKKKRNEERYIHYQIKEFITR